MNAGNTSRPRRRVWRRVFHRRVGGGGGLIQLPALFATFPHAPHTTLLVTGKLAGFAGTSSAIARFIRHVKPRLGTAVAGRGRRLCRRTRRRVACDGRFAGELQGAGAVLLDVVLVYTLLAQGPRTDHRPRVPRPQRQVARGRHPWNHRPVRTVLRPRHRPASWSSVRARVRASTSCTHLPRPRSSMQRRMPPPSSFSGDRRAVLAAGLSMSVCNIVGASSGSPPCDPAWSARSCARYSWSSFPR